MIKRDTFTAAAAMNGKAVNGKGFFTGFATDSREVTPGCMFICLRGERTDGHRYAEKAVAAGATCLLSEEELPLNAPAVVVENSVKAIQLLATDYRNKVSPLTVGITGSVGKTTTKEFTAAVLSAGFKTHKTSGNKNSETGLPITILGINPGDEACVAEMGMSGLGEIDVLTRIARPHIAVITNIGYSHIEYLKTRENILRAKLEILNGLDKDGVLILNGDDDMLSGCGKVFDRTVFFGVENTACDITATDIVLNENGTSYTVRSKDRVFGVTLPVYGRHFIYDSLAAVAVGFEAGLSDGQIINGLRTFENASGRQKIYEKAGYTVIDDTYNAVPASMKAAFGLLRELDCRGRRIAVLGDMLELGGYSAQLHREVGNALHGIDILIAYGSHAPDYAEGAAEAGMKESDIFTAADSASALEILRNTASAGDCLLFKASRSMKAEDILNGFFA